MKNTYWHKQSADKPLFADLLWARPENKRSAGKLLIVGGNKYSFVAPATAYGAAIKAGIGTARVLLPDSLKRAIGVTLAEAEYAPSTLSGSFSRRALQQLLELGQWSDGFLLAGDFGRNSETAILLDSLLAKFKSQVTVANDAVDYFWGQGAPLINRPKTASVINLGKLQHLAKHNRPDTPLLNSMMLKEVVEVLHDWTTSHPGAIVTKHDGSLIAAAEGEICTTACDTANWQTELASYVATWLAQQSQKPFAALSAAIYDFSQPSS